MAETEGKVNVAAQKRSPSDFLKQVLGRPVTVRLSSGVDYKGERLNTPIKR